MPVGARAARVTTSESAFGERLAIAVVDRLYPESYGAPAATSGGTLRADDSADQPLVDKCARLTKGTNPFAPDGGPLEAALAAVCAVEQVSTAESVAAEIEQRRRCEQALAAARAAQSGVLTAHCLTWLGLYALQGGDAVTARRFLSEAASVAETARLARIAITARRNLSVTYALEGDIAAAMREDQAAEKDLALTSMAADRRRVGPPLYAELTDFAARLGDPQLAGSYARRRAELMVEANAPAPDSADAWERVAQLLSQAVRDGSPAAQAAADAFSDAATLRMAARQKDRAVVDYTAAGVLLVENATGAAARIPLQKALAIATSLGDAGVRASVEYWLGRSYLADAHRTDGAAAVAARDRGIALLETALARLKPAHRNHAGSNSEIEATLHLWIGKALLERSPTDASILRGAIGHFREAFVDTLAHGDVNEAVSCAELVIRSTAALGEPVAAGHAAEELYDRLSATGRIDPANAARALGRQLQDALAANQSAGTLPIPVVSFYDHVAVSLVAAPDNRSAAIEALLVESAAARGDTALVTERAERAYSALVSAGKNDDAYVLADAVRAVWTGRDASNASKWLDRCAELATAAYEKAIAEKRVEAATRAADRLAAIAEMRGDVADLQRWRTVRADLCGQDAQRIEATGKTALASEAWRGAADASRVAGDLAAARSRYDRAAVLADAAQNLDSRALALAGLAAVERDLGDRTAAAETARQALADFSDLATRATDATVRQRFTERADEMRRLLAELDGAKPHD